MIRSKKKSSPSQERVVAAINTLKLPGRDIARALDCSENYLSQIKGGQKPLSKQIASRFQACFGVSARWLLDGEGDMIAEAPGGYLVAVDRKDGRAVGRVPVRRRIAWSCGSCSGEVACGLHQCPHCGDQLEWTEDQLRS